MSFVPKLLNWFEENARELPWRCDHSPYRTWISEVMLQQTQVDTVLPYFQRWMARFPDVNHLAAAEEQDVLALWEGLGYYSRAHNLHRAAKKLVDEMNGELPARLDALQALPGIGPYTAAAIASIAFNLDVAAVDGNIRRVMARLFDVSVPVRSTEGEKILWSLAETYLPQGRASEYNQALMDLGATICTPKSPKCEQCPILEDCLAYRRGDQEERPVKLPRKKVPHLTVTAAIIHKADHVLLAQRPPHGLLAGLWEFPGGTLEEVDEDLAVCLQREITEELGVAVHIVAPFGCYKHAYTHFKITLHAFICTIEPNAVPKALVHDRITWVSLQELSSYPMGKVDRLIANRLAKEGLDGILPG
ncbi:MAG: A/G-specific adenine glycosylase [Anaerolineales bacterium]